MKISSAPYLGKLVDFDKGQGVGDFGFIGQSEPVALPTLRKRAEDRYNSAFVHCIELPKPGGSGVACGVAPVCLPQKNE